jgi:hypothetical protein
MSMRKLLPSPFPAQRTTPQHPWPSLVARHWKYTRHATSDHLSQVEAYPLISNRNFAPVDKA